MKPPTSTYAEDLPIDVHPFEILESFLSNHLPLRETIEGLAKPIEEYYDNSQDDFTYSTLYLTWHTFTRIVEQTPHEHSNHMKLAELLIGMKHRTSPTGEKARKFDYEGQLWIDLPFYEPTSTPQWSSPSELIPGLIARPIDHDFDTLGQLGGPNGLRMNYMNANAFLARLAHLPGAPDYEIYGLLAMYWALEDESDAVELSLNVPGAVMWILHAGERIWKSEREWVEPWSCREAMYMSRGSPMWAEGRKNGFCAERWGLWKEFFGTVAGMVDVCEGTRELAKTAVEKMSWIEENVSRR